MNFFVITAFPQMIQDGLQWGVIGRAREKGLFSLTTINPRDFSTDVHKSIDDRPFGGGDGMVMLYEPIEKAIQSVNATSARKVYLSPTGKLLNESMVKDFSNETDILLLSGRYGGVDQRILNHYDFESISVGDYVVSGGELPALILMDAILRKKTGVLGNNESASSDSFASSPFFEAPLFTRPRENEAGKVPDILLSGDHKKIAEFRKYVGMALTLQTRPDLIKADGIAKVLSEIQKYLSPISREDLKTMGLQDSFLQRFHGK